MTQKIKIASGPYNELSHHFNGEDINRQYFHSCIVVLSDNDLIARLCIYINPYLRHNNQPVLLIGNFMSADDEAVFELLLSHAILVARSHNIHYIVGPMNGSTWDAYRLPLSEGVHPFMGDLNYPGYYSRLFMNNGFRLLHRYYTSVAPLNKNVFEGVQTAIAGVHIRQVDMNRFEEELRFIYPLCMAAFKDNVLYSPISQQDFIDNYLPFASFIDARYLLIAEDAEGIVGFIFCYPDIQCKAGKQLILKTIARHPMRKYAGLVDAMVKAIYQAAYTDGMKAIVHAFMHSDNRSYTLSPVYGGTECREYGLFIKEIYY